VGEVKEGEPFTPRTKKSFTNRTNLCVGGGPLKDPLHQIKSPRVTLSQNVSQYVNSVEGRSARLVLVSLVMQALVLHGGKGDVCMPTITNGKKVGVMGCANHMTKVCTIYAIGVPKPNQ